MYINKERFIKIVRYFYVFFLFLSFLDLGYSDFLWFYYWKSFGKIWGFY